MAAKLTLVVAAPALLGALVFSFGACSSDKSASPGDADAGPTVAFQFRPDGCQYDVAFPDRLGLVDLAKDDPAAPGSAPVRVRLGLGGGTVHGAPGYADPSHTAVFTWQTPDKVRASRVRFGSAPDAFATTASGYSWTTPPPDSGFGSNEPETYMHEVHVCGLEPARTYYYQVGGGTPETWSATQSFTTVPDSGKITVGVLGDARDKSDVWQMAQRRMRDAAVNLQLTTGDLVFVGTQESLYDTWLDAIWKDPADPNRFITLGQQMILFIGGNHENDAARFYAAFSMPGEGPWAESYASFDVGNTHFVMIDDQPIVAEGSDQGKALLQWVDDDLGRADANRAKTPFVVALNHRGLYTTSNHAIDPDVLVARKLLAPIYDKHNVDLVVNGHDHAFERSKPLRAGADPAGDPTIVAEGQGTKYVVAAGVGAAPYGVGTHPATYGEKAEHFGPDTPYIGFYSVLTLEGTKLTFTAYGLTSGATDPVVDTFDLVK